MLLELVKPVMIKLDQLSGSSQIAQGSFGNIYKAVLNNKQHVALKLMKRDHSKTMAVQMREAYKVSEM
jgi:serine/threonine protein kinase